MGIESAKLGPTRAPASAPVIAAIVSVSPPCQIASATAFGNPQDGEQNRPMQLQPIHALRSHFQIALCRDRFSRQLDEPTCSEKPRLCKTVAGTLQQSADLFEPPRQRKKLPVQSIRHLRCQVRDGELAKRYSWLHPISLLH